MKIGVNTWVWTSPLTIEEFTRLAAHIKRLGFDLVEGPIESTSDLDYTRPRRSHASMDWLSRSAPRCRPIAI